MLRFASFLLLLVSFALVIGHAAQGTDQASVASVSPGQRTLAAAAQANRYCFLYFWKQDDAAQQAMRPVFDAAMSKLRGLADAAVVNVLAADEKALVERFGVSRAPMPLVLAVAPNGAITKGLHTRFTEQEVMSSFVSLGTASCLKAVQQRKLLLLCVQNQNCQHHQEALAAAQQFSNDPRFSQGTDLVVVNPADPAEAKFLADLQIDPRTPLALTVFLAPNGQAIGKFAGSLTKEALITSFQQAQAGHCSGCKDPNCKHCQPQKKQ